MNPFTPFIGFAPVFLGGRKKQIQWYDNMLKSPAAYPNICFLGYRGLGKTSLLEALKEKTLEHKKGWIFMPISAMHGEKNAFFTKFLFDLAKSGLVGSSRELEDIRKITGRNPDETVDQKLIDVFQYIFQNTSDSEENGISFVLDDVHYLFIDTMGLIFEAVSFLQRTGAKLNLVMAGIPAAWEKLNKVDRTLKALEYDTLGLLNEDDVHEVIQKTMEADTEKDVSTEQMMTYSGGIYRQSRGYPFFIQYLGRAIFQELYFHNTLGTGASTLEFNLETIMNGVDDAFFVPIWERCSDKSQRFLRVLNRITVSAGSPETYPFSIKKSKEELRTFPDKNKNGLLSRWANDIAGLSDARISQILNEMYSMGILDRYKDMDGNKIRGEYIIALPLFTEFVQKFNE